MAGRESSHEVHASTGNNENKPAKSVLTHSLNCLNTNARSLENKIDELEGLVHMEKVDLIGVTETWETDASVLRIEGYIFHSRARTHRRGGGLAYISEMDYTLVPW